MSIALSRRPALALGASPRANLLPPSVVAAQRGRRAARGMLLGVLASVAVVAIGIGGASVVVAESAASLEAERAKSDALLAEQTRYADITALLADRSRLAQVRATAGATDIDWSGFLDLVDGTLAPGMTLLSADIQATTPVEQIVQPAAPLQRPRVATIVLTASVPDLGAIEPWLRGLQTLPGFTDAVPGSVATSPDGDIEAQVTLGVDEAAFSHRFDPSKEDK